MSNIPVNTLFEFLKVLIVCCMLVAIVWIIIRARNRNIKMKYDIIIKALENGVEIDPQKFLMPTDMNAGRLRRGCIESGVGLLIATFGVILFRIDPYMIMISKYLPENSTRASFFIICLTIVIGVVLMIVGVANILGYVVIRKRNRN